MYKIFQDYQQQISILQTRNLTITDIKQAENILRNENYYNVINGYKDLFLLQRKTIQQEEIYINGANFLEIYFLYKFDREIRSIILKRILDIENNIKSLIAYYFSEQYGYQNYLVIQNFDNNSLTRQKDIINLILKIQESISKHSLKNDAIKHYMINYGYVPLWVLVNILTFGTISKFYSMMKQSDRQKISKEFNVHDSEFEKLIGIISLFRNMCAHDERAYNFKSSAVAIKDTLIHKKMKINKGLNGYISGKNDLFAILIACKILSCNKKNEFDDMIMQINNEINILSKEIKVVKIDDILKLMGFPANWQEIKII